jgi:NAD(P)-dependent dehydrogenase (short-subunit alcohol dehydrogenase family)
MVADLMGDRAPRADTAPQSAEGMLREPAGGVAARVLVVGASAGVGRSIALELGRRGARVGLVARRRALLEELASQLDGAVFEAADVTDEATITAAVASLAERLGGLDAVVYNVGAVPLEFLRRARAATWRQALETNVVGAAVVVRAALDAGLGPGGGVVLVSSVAAGRPWPGLVAYAASKSALDDLARGLRAEEPGLRVLRVVLGPTLTAVPEGWDLSEATAALERWAAEGYLGPEILEVDEAARHVVDALVDHEADVDLLVVANRRAAADA